MYPALLILFVFVCNFLSDKETQIRSDDYGRDLSTVQTLLTKQETFDAGLVAFANEGIKSITELKDQLIQAKHDQSEAIQSRYNDIIAKSVSSLFLAYNFLFPERFQS